MSGLLGEFLLMYGILYRGNTAFRLFLQVVMVGGPPVFQLSKISLRA